MKPGKYTKPGLRSRILARVKAGSEGGRAGQWSARKAQLVASRYEAAGGGYRGGKVKTQRSLTRWTAERWTTSDGKPAIRKGGTTRYLPAAAWARLTPAQRAATNAKKREGSREGKQFVANTAAAKAKRKAVLKRVSKKAWQRIEGKNPKGGLNARGRAALKAQGQDIRPGVKGAADTPTKARRKGSFLRRFFARPRGPMTKPTGEPTRLALSAAAWGEPVPKTAEAARKLGAKGTRLLDRYRAMKDRAK
jgi:hypothetical protein